MANKKKLVVVRRKEKESGKRISQEDLHIVYPFSYSKKIVTKMQLKKLKNARNITR